MAKNNALPIIIFAGSVLLFSRSKKGKGASAPAPSGPLEQEDCFIYVDNMAHITTPMEGESNIVIAQLFGAGSYISTVKEIAKSIALQSCGSINSLRFMNMPATLGSATVQNVPTVMMSVMKTFYQNATGQVVTDQFVVDRMREMARVMSQKNALFATGIQDGGPETHINVASDESEVLEQKFVSDPQYVESLKQQMSDALGLGIPADEIVLTASFVDNSTGSIQSAVQSAITSATKAAPMQIGPRNFRRARRSPAFVNFWNAVS